MLVGYEGVREIPLAHGWPGWWSKLELFRPDLEERLGDILFFDLDTRIVGDLSDVAAVRELTVLSDFYRNERMGSGLMYLPAHRRPEVWEEWMKNPQGHMRKFRGDQEFLGPFGWQDSAKRWQQTLPGQVISYKVHVKGKGALPEGARVLCFHGKPRPWQLSEEEQARLRTNRRPGGVLIDELDPIHLKGAHLELAKGGLTVKRGGDPPPPSQPVQVIAQPEQVSLPTRPEVKQPQWAVILGGGKYVWDEMAEWEKIYGRPWDGLIIAVNDVGVYWPRPFDHWVSLHAEKMARWQRERARAELPGEYHSWGTRPYRHVTPWARGASGMLAVQVAQVVGCTRVVLCGMPMTVSPHFVESVEHGPEEVWWGADSHWLSWDKHAKKMQGWVRSMSGKTQKLLGRPTVAWLEEEA
jgi:hypothetical protein